MNFQNENINKIFLMRGVIFILAGRRVIFAIRRVIMAREKLFYLGIFPVSHFRAMIWLSVLHQIVSNMDIQWKCCEAQGKGRAKGRLRKVTQRSFIDGGWWISFP